MRYDDNKIVNSDKVNGYRGLKNKRIIQFTQNIFGIRSKRYNTPLVYFTLTKRKRLPLSFFRGQFRISDMIAEAIVSDAQLHSTMMYARILAYHDRHCLNTRETVNDVIHDQEFIYGASLDASFDLVFNGAGYRVTDHQLSKTITCHEKRYKSLRHLSDILRKDYLIA